MRDNPVNRWILSGQIDVAVQVRSYRHEPAYDGFQTNTGSTSAIHAEHLRVKQAHANGYHDGREDLCRQRYFTH